MRYQLRQIQRVKAMTDITLVEAINQALAWEMAHNQEGLVLGEDVGVGVKKKVED